MGEAKRRHRLAGTDAGVPAINARTGKQYGGSRWAGYRLTEYYDRFASGKSVTEVPCQGCTLCCYYKFVPLYPDESGEHLDVVIADDGERILRKREDGACVHLGPEGCTVYEHRPRCCRAYDCRIFSAAAIVDRFDGDRFSPHWVFDLATQRDRALAGGLQIGAAVAMGRTPDMAAPTALQEAIRDLPKNLVKAQRIVEAFDSLPYARRRDFARDINEKLTALADKASHRDDENGFFETRASPDEGHDNDE